jgi:ribonuclease VapC
MVIDTSAVIAILLDEPERASFADAIERDAKRIMSALSFLEASVVIDTRKRGNGVARLDLLIAEAGIELRSFTASDARSARRAYRRYGQGLHPAGLNFADCVAYALADDLGEPLLFKGNDFSETDIVSAIAK